MLAVYAPYGGDTALSDFPEDRTRSVLEHPLIDALRRVARTGVPVIALVDRVGDDTWLVEVSPEDPEAVRVLSRWKLDLHVDRTLTGFLLEAHERHPRAALVLGLEGHGAGYLPDLDVVQRAGRNASTVDDGHVWHVSHGEAAPFLGKLPALPGGFPTTPGGFPTTPGGFPTTPGQHQPLSTFSLGHALQRAQEQGCPRISVVHLAGCFNMSTELLHTIAPFADAASGFCNYNFFTAGAVYPEAFQKLAEAGTLTSLELAQKLADANHDVLGEQSGHPTVGGAVALARMNGIADAVDALSDELLAILRDQTGPARAASLDLIERAIVQAQNYDTDAPLALEAPDQLTDLCSLAASLGRLASEHPGVQRAAKALEASLAGIKRYGDKGVPWMDDTQSVVWDFTEPTLAMNIFLPDPLREGLWDWRAPFYFDVNPRAHTVTQSDGSTLTVPPVQTAVIDFLKATNWVEFLKEYHRDTPFRAFHLGRIPRTPMFKQGHQPGPRAVAAAAAQHTRRQRQRRPLGVVAQQVERSQGNQP
jgi:hypothetical protein